MSSIAEALKRAERERERMRAKEVPATTGGLAEVVLWKNFVEATVTPVASAIQQTPVAQAPAVRTRQQATETIVEDYTSKHKLNLPASLVVYHERAGRVAEQYRRIRERLMAENAKREPQMLVVTSAVAGEGKTTTVLNLGLSLVEIRANRVLLIDGNLHASRKGGASLSGLLKLQTQPGLVEMLSSEEEQLEYFSFIQATPWHHLYVLPTKVQGGGGTAERAVELLKSPKLHAGLRALRSQFDWVLIDSPAALDLPDAGILGGGGGADGIMMTVALHRTPEERVLRTLRLLRSMNLPVKSCILTRP
ncbi:MAG: AAA family ATPase [Phycisphaerales bacterium]|nr:AAA family ATPase [Phycisphaerales bacterium]